MRTITTLLAAAVLLGAQAQNPAYAPIEENPALPRVLLIGDSISIGYTLPVREMLKGKVNVLRPPTNAAHTGNGVANIDKWLGTGKWDVIHVNFGLHDLKIMEDGKHQIALDVYRENLDKIALRLKQTGAKLIYATTTPVPEGKLNPPRNPGDVVRYNEVAVEVMKKHGFAIDDLYAAVLPKLSTLQRPVNVHFTDEGSKFLAGKVVASILAALPPHVGFQWVNPLPASVQAMLRHETYFSKLHNTEVGYAVYLPPGYEEGTKRYPVVYYLHGGRPGGENKSAGMVKFFDQHMRAGAVAPMIYVFVNGGAVSHYDYPQLKSYGESAFVKELIPHIDGKYRTVASKKGRGLEGFSQGGRGTARIAFKHPELFCSAAPLGGGHQREKKVSENKGPEGEAEGYVFEAGNNTYDLAKKVDVKWLVAVGTKDPNYEPNLDWMKHLASRGVKFEKIIVPDVPHSATQVYEKIGPAAMKFHAACFNAR
ncbi:MAG: alpha/beta hydrolase-fold protein [Bryobacteraceae bacterium]